MSNDRLGPFRMALQATEKKIKIFTATEKKERSTSAQLKNHQTARLILARKPAHSPIAPRLFFFFHPLATSHASPVRKNYLFTGSIYNEQLSRGPNSPKVLHSVGCVVPIGE